jgi:hypothetical protein
VVAVAVVDIPVALALVDLQLAELVAVTESLVVRQLPTQHPVAVEHLALLAVTVDQELFTFVGRFESWHTLHK